MSGWLLIGLPGALYASGASEAWIATGLVLGAWANWRFVAGRLRVYTERANNALTLPDYFTHRFEDRSGLLRILSALVILVFFAIYSASGIVAGARLFENLFGVSYPTALVAGAAATILDTALRGFLAVRCTDTVQASLMIFALLIAPVVVLSLLWPRMTRNGVLAGMLVGAAVVLVWKQYTPFGLYEMVPGVLLATLAIVVVSRLGAAPSAAVRQTFAQVQQEYAAAHR